MEREEEEHLKASIEHQPHFGIYQTFQTSVNLIFQCRIQATHIHTVYVLSANSKIYDRENFVIHCNFMNERRSCTIDMCNKSTVSNYIVGNIDKLISEAKVEYNVGVCAAEQQQQ